MNVTNIYVMTSGDIIQPLTNISIQPVAVADMPQTVVKYKFSQTYNLQKKYI